MINSMKLGFTNRISIIKNINFFSLKNFSRGYYSIKFNLSNIQKYKFCNLARLNFDKLYVNKPVNSNNNENPEFKLIKDEEDLKKKEGEKSFILEDNIIEFGPNLNWDEVVMKSDIPVLVDCYAE